MDLIPYIYFEKQEPGSMLCAQHALNNLMQSPMWTPDNLAEIARKLDLIEHTHLQHDDNENSRVGSSSNYDDSGFFSVQVIDDALHQLGLRIVRWRSEEMKPMHGYPENQEAFILNHDLHWFTLRRFGQSADRWYNLNSMAEDTPRWIGPTFLSMAIAQAEAEGYSIFTVLPVMPSSEPSGPQPGNLMSCEADEHALLLDQLSYSSAGGSGSSGSSALRRPREEAHDQPSRRRMRMNEEDAGVNDLSYEDQLRLAIAASLDDSSSGEKEQSASATYDPECDPTKPSEGLDSHLDFSHHQKLTSKSANIEESNLDISQDLRSIEDKELETAISESLLTHSPCQSTTNLRGPEPSSISQDEIVDEPNPEELRQRRLARFS